MRDVRMPNLRSQPNLRRVDAASERVCSVAT